MDYMVHGILQARMLRWIVFAFSRGSSQPRDQSQIFCIQGDSLPAEPPGKPRNTGVGNLLLLQWILLTQELNWGLLHSGRDSLPTELSGKPSFRECGSRWWHRRILDSPPLMNSVNLQLHMKQSPLKKIWKLAEHLLHLLRWGKVTLRWIEQAEIQSHYKLNLWCINQKWRRYSQTWFFFFFALF